MELQVKIIGGLFVVLAFLHIFFPRYFNWKKDLAPLTLMNRQMMYVHSGFIAFGIFLLGLLCLTSPAGLLYTALGRRVCLGLGIFWAARLYVQLFGYSSTLWKGRAFETAVHVVFILAWGYVSVVFFAGYFGR